MMFARLAMPEDEDAVVELARMQVAETLPHLRFDEAITRQTFVGSIRFADPTIFVIEDKRVVIGYLLALMKSYAFTDGVHAGQEVIFVRPDKRGTRAAAHLVQAFNAWADRIGAKEVYMGVANGFRPERTAKFMQHFGFAPVGQYLRRIRGNEDVDSVQAVRE